mmetsp:Transcript_31591/g.100736  ORF Transcript_31591/g.100736 Transcript_31591/m.100736 type:complete len:266 (-) Transcript_31591:39-836(-)
MAANPYLPYYQPKEGAKMRVFAFHWAGASASMLNTFPKAMPDEVEFCAVQLPGRERRTAEPLLKTCQEAAVAVVDALGHMFKDGVPSAFLGHSMGTWTAFEVARELRRRGIPLPKAMFMSCFPAPQTPTGVRPWHANRGLSEAAFKDEMRTWGVNDIIFKPDVWKSFHDVFRNDFGMFDEYVFTEEPPLQGVEMHAFISEGDPKVKGEMMEGWREQTNRLGGFTLTRFTGDHFYVQDAKLRGQLAEAVAREVGNIVDFMDDAVAF